MNNDLQLLRPAKILWISLLLCCSLTAFAHRGEINEADPCRIMVGDIKTERIHFSAYTRSTGIKSYCEIIPTLEPTNLVFDYEGQKIRKLSIEFEVTKLPEGTRIFYQEPRKISTGTVNGLVDFSKYGAGNYQVHVTIVDKDGKIDTHIPFAVGIEDNAIGKSTKTLIIIAVALLLIVLVIVLAKFKDRRTKTENAE